MKALHASKGRKSAHQFIAEGPAAVSAALAAKRFPVEALYLTEDGAQHIPEKYRSRAIFLTEKVMAAISTVENSQGIIAICSMAESSNADEIFGRTSSPLIYCSEVNDPGNLGTIIRTADALGCAGVLLSPGSADPFEAATKMTAEAIPKQPTTTTSQPKTQTNAPTPANTSVGITLLV